MHKTFALDFLQSMMSIWVLSLHTDRSVKVPHIQHPHCCVSIYQLMMKMRPLFSRKILHLWFWMKNNEAGFTLKRKDKTPLFFRKNLKPDGWVITSGAPFVNIPNYPALEAIKAELARLPHAIVIDIEQLAKDNGVPRSSNVILLGAAQKAIGIDYAKLEAAVRRVFARKGEAVVDANLRALAIGKQTADS